MAKKSFLGFIIDQSRKLPPVVKADLTGKTAIIIGANAGLGYETAQHFANMGVGKLILACRSKDRGEAAVQRLKGATGCSTVELRIVDLADFSSVKAFAEEVERDLERVDILVLNAATITGSNLSYSSTKDGLQVNNISQSLLALLLLPRMLETARRFDTIPRIVAVTSEMHFWATFEDRIFASRNAFEALSSEEYCTPRVLNARYTHTKLLNIFFIRALNNRLKSWQPIIVNSVNPGFCYSELFRNEQTMRLKIGMWFLARPAEAGSRQLVWAAVGKPDGNGQSLADLRGAYIHQAHIDEPSDFVLGEEGKKREDKLWNGTMKKSMLSFLYDQCGAAPPVARADLKGKTVLVVGANTGLGFEATKHFAVMGPERLILACRNQEKGEAAIQRLEEATGYKKAELWLVDLAEFSSTRAFVDRALKDLERLDVLLLNAAMASPNYSQTKDGWESALQVNDLSLSLLALLLLPLVSETSEKFNVHARIVIVSSEVHYWTRFKDDVFESPNAFKLLSSKEYCTPLIFAKRYLDTKLLNIFFTRALNNRLKDKSVIVSAVNPAFCYSELRRERQSVFNTVFEWLFARTAEEGSRQLVFGSVGVPEGGVEQLKGAYIHLNQVTEPSDLVLGEEGKKREDKLWDDLISVLTEVDSRITDVVNKHFQ
ncbi:hypothetical protein NP233_g1598 [Leucocoprinus birnbaumii]|uniref:WW domain-containing oxidoreductase n=1 Tax=Leucocoprinus birnbaumii TaxID=56174 RepID=A0AAD5W5E9_9AGAR|nr:hypothetical protein NP233_g1598 [Leucocoprinus birnbaumii]